MNKLKEWGACGLKVLERPDMNSLLIEDAGDGESVRNGDGLLQSSAVANKSYSIEDF